MAFICITPNVAMVRINAREHLEDMPGNFYINLDTLVEARMKEVRKEHEGDFSAELQMLLKTRTHGFLFRNSPAGNKAKETLTQYLTERSINCGATVPPG